MSSFVVEDTHLDVLLTAGLARADAADLKWIWCDELGLLQTNELHGANANAIGQMLLGENQRSVNNRYQEDKIARGYRFESLPGYERRKGLIVLKAISLFEYQCGDYEGWWSSEARAFCAALRKRVTTLLPGYDEIRGGEVSDREVFTKAQ